MNEWICIALPFIKKWEGCKLTAYPDPVSGGAPWTIGYGATGVYISEGTHWTQAEADADLLQRLATINTSLTRAIRVRITQNQRAALASLAYNVGTTSIINSTLLRLLNACDYQGAADQFPRWNHAGSTVVPGLTNRRAAEKLLFEGDV